MPNVRSEEKVLLTMWCSRNVVRELRRVVKRRKASVTGLLLDQIERIIRDDYAERGKKIPKAVESALAHRDRIVVKGNVERYQPD